MRWLTLLTSLPPTPTRHRVGVWRKLQRMGAVRLRGSAWILPETPETTELFPWLVQEIQSFRGKATLLRVDRIENMGDEQVTALFHQARATEYTSRSARVDALGNQKDPCLVAPIVHLDTSPSCASAFTPSAGWRSIGKDDPRLPRPCRFPICWP